MKNETKHILIIDDSSDFRNLIRVLLKNTLLDIELAEYDPSQHGRPPDNFDWSKYDVLLLDYQLGLDENGLDWLKFYKDKKKFPATIMLTAEGDEYVATQALKLGAVDYSNKRDLSSRRLKSLIEEAMGYSIEEQKIEKEVRNKASDIIQDIRNKKVAILKKDTDIGYRLIRLIGKGPFSQVYLAERNSDGISLVIKLLDLSKTKDTAWTERFKQEAQLIRELNSPFIVKIHDYGTTHRYAYIAMEFFPRGDLKHRMEQNINPCLAINYMTHIAYSLKEIHAIGIVHRDLKPANIMFRGDDSLALADFGISKKIESDNNLTIAGQVLGTPNYMSPEQARGKTADVRSDIYSAGIMLYELLTGEKPYKGNTALAIMFEHVQGEIPKLPIGLESYQEIIDTCLAKEPSSRYQSAQDLITVLEQTEQQI